MTTIKVVFISSFFAGALINWWHNVAEKVIYHLFIKLDQDIEYCWMLKHKLGWIDFRRVKNAEIMLASPQECFTNWK